MADADRCVVCGEIIPEGGHVCKNCDTYNQAEEKELGQCCGIDEAIRYIREHCPDDEYADRVINRLRYHRRQAVGAKPKYNKGMSIKSYYTCRNCGFRLDIVNNYCPNCGYFIKWDSCRCLTGLPLVDAAEKAKEG